jgi:hypothetical protein
LHTGEKVEDTVKLTYADVIKNSNDPERTEKLFNRLYNNTLASTGPYTMDMFVYNRTVVFKARKRVKVVSTFPNIKHTDSYPLKNIKDKND